MLIGDFYLVLPDNLATITPLSIYFPIFLLIILFLSFIFKNKLKAYLFLLADLFFLYTYGLYHLITNLVLALFTYLFSLFLKKFNKKRDLFIAIIPFIIILLTYKMLPLYNVNFAMPLGLSFSTFKAISYLCDYYRGKIEKNNLVSILNYILFFPTMTAGPINRYEAFEKDLTNNNEFDYLKARQGALRIGLGLYEKMVFCAYISDISTTLMQAEYTGYLTLLGIFLYSFEIYLDFDAISNIAIGAGNVLGINLKENFRQPYLANSLHSFWKRWHISLSAWFRDYVYIPLGGNRAGKFRRYLNMLIVFLLSGIWHGSTLNYIIWGIAHGLIETVEELFFTLFKQFKIPKFIKYILNIIGIIINFIIVSFLWLIFRYQAIDKVIEIIKRLTKPMVLDLNLIGLGRNEIIWLIVVIGLVIIIDLLREFLDLSTIYKKTPFIFRWLFYLILIVTFMVFGVYGGSHEANDFIYRFF